jgi:hypothetical protein
VAVWLIGAATYLTIAGIHVKGLNVDGRLPELGGTLPGFIVAFVLHLVLGRLALRRPAAAAASAEAGGLGSRQ